MSENLEEITGFLVGVEQDFSGSTSGSSKIKHVSVLIKDEKDRSLYAIKFESTDDYSLHALYNFLSKNLTGSSDSNQPKVSVPVEKIDGKWEYEGKGPLKFLG